MVTPKQMVKWFGSSVVVFGIIWVIVGLLVTKSLESVSAWLGGVIVLLGIISLIISRKLT